MIEVFHIGQGDTLPYYYFQVRDQNGPINLSGVLSTTFRMARISTASVIVSAVALITDPVAGSGEYRWSAADTAQTGSFAASLQFDTLAGSYNLPRSEVAKVVVEDRFVIGT